VEVFCRSDDAPEGVHVKVTGSVMVDKDMKENPSPRREGVVISFFCENCPGKFELHIVQHKGNTLLYINDLDLKVIPEVKV
jgi:hypothetical protein